jgi:hypothetical protein
MAYNSETGVITGPVSIYDVQRALGVSSNDNSTLCTHQNINIWAKYKPVANSILLPAYMSQWNNILKEWNPNANWFHGTQAAGWRYGLSFNEYNSISALIAAYDNRTDNMNGWVYHRPQVTANSKPRLSDFASYNHKAGAFGAGFIVSSPVGVDNNNYGTLIASFSYNINAHNSITPENLFDDDIYFGVALVRNGSVLYGTADQANEFIIQKSIQFSAQGTYDVYPFFCTAKQVFNAALVSNKFYTIPLLTKTTLAVQSQSSSFRVSIQGEYLTGTQQNPYKTRAVITITPTANISYQNCYFELNRFGETPNQEMVTLSWNAAGTDATCSLRETHKSLQSTPYFNISSSNIYTITISGLDPNASYDGYLHSGNLSKRFSIMEVIQQ